MSKTYPIKLAVLSSTKSNESRIPFTLRTLQKLPIAAKSQLIFEDNYGQALRIRPHQLQHLGYQTATRHLLLREYEAFLILKPTLEDFKNLPKGSTLIGWIHAVQNKALVDIAIERSLTLIALEELYWKGQHLFHQNNYYAGTMGVIHATSLWKQQGNMPGNACVIGQGHCSDGAISAFLSLGIKTDIFSRYQLANHLRKLPISHNTCVTKDNLLMCQNKPLSLQLKNFDVIVNCIKQDVLNPVSIIKNDKDLTTKNPHLIIDISCDEKMGFHFARATTRDKPITKISPMVSYYSIDNIPSLKPFKSSQALSAVFSTHITDLLAYCLKGKDILYVEKAEILSKGIVRDPTISQFQKRSHTSAECA